MTDNQMDSEPKLTVEQRLAGVAEFLGSKGIEAVFFSGILNDNREFDGMAFMAGQADLGEIKFTDGQAVEASTEEHERRLAVDGFVNNAIRPLQRAVRDIYDEGGDLFDERLDVLPGFNS